MNQGKLEVVKQEMARVNVNILGISELKWTGMGEFNSDDHYIYYCGQESLRRNGVAIMVNKRVRNAVLGCNLKNDKMISVHLQGKPFNVTVIQAYAPTSSTEEAEVEQFYEDLQNLVELTPHKDVFFIKSIMDYGMRFMTLYRRQGSRPSPWKRNASKATWLSGEALQTAEEGREAKGKGEEERHTHLNAEFQRLARRSEKAFLSCL